MLVFSHVGIQGRGQLMHTPRPVKIVLTRSLWNFAWPSAEAETGGKDIEDQALSVNWRFMWPRLRSLELWFRDRQE
jgi:hypothetical protein